ncbi:DUF4157 domain-containing protein [Terriglobus roseus]|uniref:eCIS core domain-containing protein n=1 Tax=Terriglobus roseus TaxID=392734 RepID=A0A1G7J846_9BACT|nr:DUF4157 domain-containing protein [Terriglobus roseus]SDF21056.1 protein of unknown function [Terriglobus roseus]
MTMKHANAAGKQSKSFAMRRQGNDTLHAASLPKPIKQFASHGAVSLSSVRSVRSVNGTSGKDAPIVTARPSPRMDTPRNEQLEAQADRMASHVARRETGVRLSSPKVQGQKREIGAKESATKYEQLRDQSSGGGEPLDTVTQSVMERRFERGLSHIRIHRDGKSAHKAEKQSMRAYTLGSDIVFAPGRYNPAAVDGQELLAHEISHAIQQQGGEGGRKSREDRPMLSATQKHVQAKVEIRQVGRGEASAFGRRQELLDRMNRLSTGMQYALTGPQITYTVLDASHLTAFDQQMRGFIDRADTVPLRLVTSAALTQQGSPTFKALNVDSFDLGYLDLDDMRASDDNSFQMNLVHLLRERFATSRYDHRIGTFTPADDPEFQRAHAAGVEAESQLLRDKVGDPTIHFVFEEDRSDNLMVFGYRSREGYSIFHVLRSTGGGVMAGHVFVQTKDNRRLSLDDFIAERNRTAAAHAAASSSTTVPTAAAH